MNDVNDVNFIFNAYNIKRNIYIYSIIYHNFFSVNQHKRFKTIICKNYSREEFKLKCNCVQIFIYYFKEFC